MLDQAVARVRNIAVAPNRATRSDHSMDALQYILAVLAILAAVALASVR